MAMDTLGTLGLAPVRKKWNFVLGQSLFECAVLFFLQARGKALFDLIWITLVLSSFAFGQLAKHGAGAIILDDTFPSIVTGVKWGCSAYIYNIQKFAEFLLKCVLPLIVYCSSACLTGNAQLTAVLLLMLGALAKKTMSTGILSFFILMGLVFLLEIQVVEGRGLKAVSDVKASPPLTSFEGMFYGEKKADPIAYPPPSSADKHHH